MIKLPKIKHLIRYLAAIGIVFFFAYWTGFRVEHTLIVMGPCLYLAAAVRDVLVRLIPSLPSSKHMLYFGFLLPTTLLYFGVGSFLFKKLWNEKGLIRYASVAGFVVFLVYIHYTAWENLLDYLRP